MISNVVVDDGCDFREGDMVFVICVEILELEFLIFVEFVVFDICRVFVIWWTTVVLLSSCVF